MSSGYQSWSVTDIRDRLRFSPRVLDYAFRILRRVPVFSRTNQLVIDGLLSFLSIFVAFQLRFDGQVAGLAAYVLWFWAPILFLARPLVIWGLRGYQPIWRYFEIRDIQRLALVALPVSAGLLLARHGFAGKFQVAGVPTTVIFIDWCVYLLLGTTARALRRAVFDMSRNAGRERSRALIVGTDETLPGAVRHVHYYPDVQVMGLLAREESLRGLTIGGFRVIGAPAALPRLLAAREIDLVIISDASLDCIASVVSAASEFDAEVRLLPSAANVFRGEVRVSAEPKPEAVLMDRAVALAAPHPAVVQAFSGRVVLVTGAGGSIGSEICRQLTGIGISTLLLVDQDENSIFELNNHLLELQPELKIIPLVADIRDRERMRGIFGRYRPEIILHSAAYKHVPVMEFNCSEAVLNNVIGTRELADAAIEFRVERFLMISTDKAVRPTSIMGASKRVAELLVQERAARQNGSGTRFACVRFGNVVGSRGSVVPIFLQQIQARRLVTLTDENMTRYFMTIPEAVQLVLQASTLGMNGDIYMLDMGDPIKIATLARKLIELSALRPEKDVPIKVVGARPGEKIHEQLWSADAKVSATEFGRVFRVHARPVVEQFDQLLAELEAAALRDDNDAVRRQFTCMPIEFKVAPAIAAGA